MEFVNYDELIKKNRNSLIDSYVKQYGEKFRIIIEQRFDSIRFCFFETPDRLKGYISKKSICDGQRLTLEFMEEIGYNISDDIHKEFYKMKNDDILERVLYAFFPDGGHMSLRNLEDGIFAYFNEEHKYNRAIKLRINNLGFDDEQVRKFLSVLEKYKKQFVDVYFYLLNLAEALDAKIKGLEGAFEKKESKTELDKKILYYSIMKLCIINNFDIDEFDFESNEYDILFMSFDGRHLVEGLAEYKKTRNGEIVPVVYISPLDDAYSRMDVTLDHEIRHAIEYSLSGKIKKTGLAMTDMETGEKYNHRLNEIMCEKMSLESTYERHKNGIYIFNNQQEFPIGGSDYYYHIGTFDSMFDFNLYQSMVSARLMDGLDELYKIITPEELEKCEQKLYDEEFTLK